MPPNKDPKAVFYQYFPKDSIEYCFGLWQKHNFHFNIKKKRNTKLGDYRYSFVDKSHTITVNADLNPFAFLITYLHEVAHLIVQVSYKSGIDPHGAEWKNTFRNISAPMLNSEIFPDNVLGALNNYFKNPKASSCADPVLMKALHTYNIVGSEFKMLSELNIGVVFEFNGRQFLKEEVRRTRVLCKETASGRRFLISKIAVVSMVI